MKFNITNGGNACPNCGEWISPTQLHVCNQGTWPIIGDGEAKIGPDWGRVIEVLEHIAAGVERIATALEATGTQVSGDEHITDHADEIIEKLTRMVERDDQNQ